MRALRLRDGRVVAALLVVALAVVVLLNQFAPTRSAYSATVANTGNTAATAPYFTCAAAARADAAGALFAYDLDEAPGRGPRRTRRARATPAPTRGR